MAQILLKLETTFQDTLDSDSPTVWYNGCPFVLTKRKTRTELLFSTVGVPDNSLFPVEERTRLFSELEESLKEEWLDIGPPSDLSAKCFISVSCNHTLRRSPKLDLLVYLLVLLPPLSDRLPPLPCLAVPQWEKTLAIP